MNEPELQRAVIELARLLGYRVAHFRPALTEHGWRTPVQGDGKGFPDLVLARRGRLIVAELKAGPGRLTVEQRAWLDLLAATGVEAHLWRSAQWSSGEIELVLRGPRVYPGREAIELELAESDWFDVPAAAHVDVTRVAGGRVRLAVVPLLAPSALWSVRAR